MSWRQVPPHRRVPFEGYPQEAREALLERIAQEARQMVLARKGIVADHVRLPESRGGLLVNGDLVNTLLPSVRENPTLGLAALHEASLETLMDLFQVHQWIEEWALDQGRGRPVLITMGGQASGKTSLASFAEGVGAILDAPHTDAEGLKRKIEKLLGQQREVWVVWVHRNPRHALRSMLLRAVEEGRPVRLAQMASAHYRAPQAFETVGRAFRGQPRISLFHAMNLDGPSEVQVRGGRMDREGKDALELLEHLPPWQEEDFLGCLLEGFLEAAQGKGLWRDFPPAEDVIRFLWRDVPETVAVQPGSKALDPTLDLQAPLAPPPVPPPSLSSPLETPLPDVEDACGQLTQALQNGIAWNGERLQSAFQEVYQAVPSAWT